MVLHRAKTTEWSVTVQDYFWQDIDGGMSGP